MAEEQKPKRKYTRRAPRVEPLAVYSVLVRVTRGRKVETIYGETTRVENGCLVVVSMDGPQPLVEKTRYIPLASAEIEVCARPQPVYRQMPQNAVPVGAGGGWGVVTNEGPRVEPGPLELARQREAMSLTARPRPTPNLVERNADGVPVVTAGFLDGSPT